MEIIPPLSSAALPDRFQELADLSPAILFVTTADGRWTYVSRGWFDFTGQTEKDALGFGWLEAVHPSDREASREALLAAAARCVLVDLEHRVQRHDGAYRWMLGTGRPRVAAEGRFEGYVGAVIDIHDRKVAEERLDLAVTSGEVGLWYCDLPFDVLVWNRHVKEHFGLPPDATVTIDLFYERLHPDDREPTRQAIETAIARQTTYDSQYRTVGLDGRTRWIRAIGRAHYDGERPVRFDGITIDVTELMALRDTAESASRAKDAFLAMLGHELRNPLAPILTALQLIRLRGIDAVERERIVIERQVRHLVGLVDDLLDVSRITRGLITLRRAHVDMADVVARAVEIASPLFEQQRHTLELEVPRGLMVDGDAGRLAQVIANLLTNAAKYTPAGGRIRVDAARGTNGITVAVRDTGIGLGEEMLPHVFSLFVQAPQTLARSDGGLGLGLSIVKSLVELHGGAVAAASEGRGKGATFTIRLPEAPARGPGDDASDTSGSTAVPLPAGTRVLVVDDNHDGAELLGRALAMFGYETRTVHDAPAALEEAERFQPRIALVDLGLPVMDGFELARRIRTSPRLGAMKLVAVTGYGQARDRDASARAGFDEHLVKPVDLDVLRRVLARLEA